MIDFISHFVKVYTIRQGDETEYTRYGWQWLYAVCIWLHICILNIFYLYLWFKLFISFDDDYDEVVVESSLRSENFAKHHFNGIQMKISLNCFKFLPHCEDIFTNYILIWYYFVILIHGGDPLIYNQSGSGTICNEHCNLKSFRLSSCVLGQCTHSVVAVVVAVAVAVQYIIIRRTNHTLFNTVNYTEIRIT